jgi:hypothetical protein
MREEEIEENIPVKIQLMRVEWDLGSVGNGAPCSIVVVLCSSCFCLFDLIFFFCWLNFWYNKEHKLGCLDFGLLFSHVALLGEQIVEV